MLLPQSARFQKFLSFIRWTTSSSRPMYGPGMRLRDHPPIEEHYDDLSDDEVFDGRSSYVTNDSETSSYHSGGTPSSSFLSLPVSHTYGDGVTPTSWHPRNARGELRALLQQQATLDTILQNQSSMQRKQSELEIKLTELERKVSTESPSSSSSSGSSRKRKQIISRELSCK